MEVTQNESPNLFCCACLSSEGRLFNIHDKLAFAFAYICGSHVQDEPQHLCVYCHALLCKFAAFRDMCLRTQQTLVPGALQLDTDCKLRINNAPHRFYNLNISQVEIIDIGLSNPEDIKVEPNIDIVNIDNIINDTVLKTEFDHKKDEEENDDGSIFTDTVVKEVKDIKTKKRKTGTVKKKREIEFVNDEIDDLSSEENTVKEVKDIKTKKRLADTAVKREIEIGFDDAIDDVSSEENYKNPVKKRKVTKRKTVAVKKENTVLKTGTDSQTVDKRRKKNVASKNETTDSDFAATESAYAVKVLTLSKEEQLEEIASRKKTRNYLESRFRCEECGKGFDSEPAYKNHQMRHSSSAGSLVCEICFLRFKMKCRLLKHEESHRLKFMCLFGDGCNFVSRDRTHAKNHHAMHTGKTFECQHCGKSFNKSTTYLTHVRLSHPAMNVACDICGETFVSQKGCRLHKNRMHPEKPPQLKCSTCSANFNNIEALNRHTDTAGEHRGLRPCEQCGENCASETELQEHVKEKHPTEIHKCEECNMTFSSASSYDVHHRRKHLNEQSRPRRPRRVDRKKYNDRPRQKLQFVCEQCGLIKPAAHLDGEGKTEERGENAALLRYHQRIHDGVRPFVCSECPKAFTLKSALVWHIRTHTGEKPYQCDGCPRAFNSKANFNRHRRTVHLGIRGNCPCPICGRVLTNNSDVRVHVNSVHRGLPWPKRDRKRKIKAFDK